MIVGAKFITSFEKFYENFNSNISEIAFLGRSNVGKSSLINALCKQKNLAKSSSTPGKTRLINIFEVRCKKDEDSFNINFIDLPGFGYARVSKSMRENWDKNLDLFLKKRSSIKLFVHLIDSRHTNLELDLDIQNYLNSLLKPDQTLLKIFTKCDKLNQSQKSKLKQNFKDAYLVSNQGQNLDNIENLLINKALGL
ncbi:MULTISPECIES: ribosome biogenesis GTP-binding protein YihA/YsxC [unclassified Campylobacter]|uniref:ribosome biogenesis GTP-binding protein YihA/YsxC n=1 Tax=unclassified Campylobacter TaxID=2593542 RepID=UPI001237AFD8|nr:MULTISPECIES: ribosome biogenesis GTP-binding protein YihA/YsxC [unclassified Campylobacter]KAA6226419.1 YihA family ribosome biogenesis GTP-binding protein [Campylobacter sp. LR286c]KAA6226543.1 YihA family ribosome biogenesis GTP-binding protein [Campylobacter sp. LR185c]KAA6226907.1 YihA family ribosome biogenesis GTP-binding protein [Campylobacter sp. LR196d]KAA6233651.1 YihA family ribosome biogenesis GTP-binding protein [Campylobacter sp. LR291e]KAA6233871.1 YihA family ribosome bioge